MWVVISSISAAICFIICIVALWLRSKAKSVSRQMSQIANRDKTILKVHNGLVVSIAIGKYDGNRFDDLPVQKDVESLRDFSTFLNYKFLPESDSKLRWTQNEVMRFLEEDVATEFTAKDEDGNLKYDGLLVAVSGHGIQNRIITSDMKRIEKTAMHRCISNKHPEIRHLPRIFLFDVCGGNASRSESDEKEQKEVHKDVRLEDVEVEDAWTTTTHNPDYNTAQIHAANDGYTANMREDVGSYLIALFTYRVQRNIGQQKGEGLADIMQKVQDDLHDKGKQQTVNVFNNNTRNLQFEISSRGMKNIF